MVWKIVSENNPKEKTLHVGDNREDPGDVTSLISCKGRVMAYDQEDHDVVFAGSDDGFVAMFDGKLNFEKDWKAQEMGVNCIAVGKDENETLWLYSCSAFGEIKQWWPAAVELIYQNTAWHPGSESKGFTSAGGSRDSSVKQLYWHDGFLYSGDDAGVICKWDSMLNLLWNTNIYSDVASLAISGKEEDGQRVFAGNLVTSTIVVGDLRPKRKPEDSIEVATMITGKGPLSVTESGDFLACACYNDYSVIVYARSQGPGTTKEWKELAKLEHHTDQVNGLSISDNGKMLASCGWDGNICIWSLETFQLLECLKCGEYLNCVTWSRSSSEAEVVFTGGKAGSVVKIENVS